MATPTSIEAMSSSSLKGSLPEQGFGSLRETKSSPTVIWSSNIPYDLNQNAKKRYESICIENTALPHV